MVYLTWGLAPVRRVPRRQPIQQSYPCSYNIYAAQIAQKYLFKHHPRSEIYTDCTYAKLSPGCYTTTPFLSNYIY